MLADLCLVSDDFTVVADKACVEVEDDVDEEEDVDNRVKDKHCDVCRVAWRPEQSATALGNFGMNPLFGMVFMFPYPMLEKWLADLERIG